MPSKSQSSVPNKDTKRLSGNKSGSMGATSRGGSSTKSKSLKTSSKARGSANSSLKSSPKGKPQEALLSNRGKQTRVAGPIDYKDTDITESTSQKTQPRKSPMTSKGKIKEAPANARGAGATEGGSRKVMDKNLVDDETLEAMDDEVDMDEVASDGDDRAMRAGAPGREEFEDEDYFDDGDELDDDEDEDDNLKMSKAPRAPSINSKDKNTKERRSSK